MVGRRLGLSANWLADNKTVQSDHIQVREHDTYILFMSRSFGFIAFSVVLQTESHTQPHYTTTNSPIIRLRVLYDCSTNDVSHIWQAMYSQLHYSRYTANESAV